MTESKPVYYEDQPTSHKSWPTQRIGLSVSGLSKCKNIKTYICAPIEKLCVRVSQF